MSHPRLPGVDETPRCFISYRHEDASQTALWLEREIREFFGPDCVFVDTCSIPGGSEWPSRILDELSKAKVVLALMGLKWLRAKDEHGQRYIDKDDDWVRLELINANNANKIIVPILLDGVNPPPANGLPTELKFLSNKQAIHLHPSTNHASHFEVMKFLEHNGFTPLTRNHAPLPTNQHAVYKLADKNELDSFLHIYRHWKIERRPFPGLDTQRGRKERIGIGRDYEFASFEDAIHFMADASRDNARIRHYPEWENVWRTVSVWYSTWDLKGAISTHDLFMAAHLDALYSRFRERETFCVTGLPDWSMDQDGSN